MICLLALIIFGILGIFSATHRKIAYEAFDCVFRRITLRKCETGLDKRLKSQITGKLMRKWPRIGRWTFRHFEMISWFFTILLLASLVYSGHSLYNVYIYGNCYGPEPEGFCIFDPFRTAEDNETCTLEGPVTKNISVLPIHDDDPSIGPEDAKVIIIEAGCFQCKYTMQAQDVVKKILDEYEGKIRFVYKDFPLSSVHKEAERAAMAAQCANDQGRFWEYANILFKNQEMLSDEGLKMYAADLGLNAEEFNECLDSDKYKEKVDEEHQEGIEAGIYGTPTFFVNDRVIVGPKSFREFKGIIDEELGK